MRYTATLEVAAPSFVFLVLGALAWDVARRWLAVLAQKQLGNELLSRVTVLEDTTPSNERVRALEIELDKHAGSVAELDNKLAKIVSATAQTGPRKMSLGGIGR